MKALLGVVVVDVGYHGDSFGKPLSDTSQLQSIEYFGLNEERSNENRQIERDVIP